MDTLHICVGSDDLQRRAGGEKLFAAAVQAVATGPYKLHWMRATPSSDHLIKGGTWQTSKDGLDGSWNTGCEFGDVYPKSGGWGTPFTHFRWAVPEFRNFEGHAIYCDCDQFFLKDPRELWEEGRATPKPVYLSQMKACVMVLDCAAFSTWDWWPSISEQKQGSGTMYELRSILQKRGLIDPSMSRHWNEPDKVVANTGLVHYTNARTQPWYPYEAQFGRPAHRDDAAVKTYRRIALLAQEIEFDGELIMDGRD